MRIARDPSPPDDEIDNGLITTKSHNAIQQSIYELTNDYITSVRLETEMRPGAGQTYHILDASDETVLAWPGGTPISAPTEGDRTGEVRLVLDLSIRANINLFADFSYTYDNQTNCEFQVFANNSLTNLNTFDGWHEGIRFIPTLEGRHSTSGDVNPNRHRYIILRWRPLTSFFSSFTLHSLQLFPFNRQLDSSKFTVANP